MASAGVFLDGSPWTWFVCRVLLLEDWLDGCGLCLAALLEVLFETLLGLGLPGALVASSPRLATSLFRLDGRSGDGLLVAVLPRGYYWVLPGLGPPGLVAAIPRYALLNQELLWAGVGACLRPCG